MDLPELQEHIAHYLDLKTLTNLCITSKKINKILNHIGFWQEHYTLQGIPFVKNNFTFKQWICQYRYDYNAMLLAKHLIKKSFKFDFDYHYGGTGVVINTLDKMGIIHNLLQYTLKTNIKLTMDDLKVWNPFVSINKHGNRYRISLYIDYCDEEGDRIAEIDMDVARLDRQEILLFLYLLINTNHFVYKARHAFHKATYREYSKILNIQFE